MSAALSPSMSVGGLVLHSQPWIECCGAALPCGKCRRGAGWKSVLADGGLELVVAADVRPEDRLPGDTAGERRLIDNLLRRPHPGGQRLQVIEGLPKVEENRWRGVRISALQPDFTARRSADASR